MLDLFRAYRAAEGAQKLVLRNQLVLANYALAKKKARAYWPKDCPEDEQQDYVQAAVIGLIKAIEKFDPDKGFTFSTYACNWIRHQIQVQAYVDSWKTRNRAKLPPMPLRRAEQAFLAKHGRAPTAADLGISVEEYQDWFQSPQVFVDNHTFGEPTTEDESYVQHASSYVESVDREHVRQAYEEAREEVSPATLRSVERDETGRAAELRRAEFQRVFAKKLEG